MKAIECEFRNPIPGDSRGWATCARIADLTKLPRDRCIVSLGACKDCSLRDPDMTNPVLVALAHNIAKLAAPDRAGQLSSHLRYNAKPKSKAPQNPPEKVVLNSDEHGYGDAMIMAWASEGAKQGPTKLVHYATGDKRKFLELFGQPVTSDPAGAVTTYEAYEGELRHERGEVPRVVSRARYIGIHTEPKRPPLGEIPGPADFWAAKLENDLRGPKERPLVLLFPQTAYTSREWPASYWVDLAWRLKNEHGVATSMLLGHSDDRYTNVPNYQYGFPWENVFALMLRADLVVANDSGPAHIAGTLDVPTLALMGPTKASIFAHMPSVHTARVGKKTIECDGCHFNAPYRAACDQGCLSLYRLHVEAVLQRVLQLIGLEKEPEPHVIPLANAA